LWNRVYTSWQEDPDSLQFCHREWLFFPPPDCLFSAVKPMVIWARFLGEGEGRGWVRSRGRQSSAETGLVAGLEVSQKQVVGEQERISLG